MEKGRCYETYNKFTMISAPITSTLGTLQHHNRFIEGSLLAKHAEKYAIKINKFRSASIVSALLWARPKGLISAEAKKLRTLSNIFQNP